MTLVKFVDLMEHAERESYAVGYFESWNLESLQGVVDAAERAVQPRAHLPRRRETELEVRCLEVFDDAVDEVVDDIVRKLTKAPTISPMPRKVSTCHIERRSAALSCSGSLNLV